MQFQDRDVQYQGRKQLIKVDSNNQQISGTEAILINTIRDEGDVYADGTPLTAEVLNKGNWRDDRSLSFAVLENNEYPASKFGQTQIVTDSDGQTWLIPPDGGKRKELIKNLGLLSHNDQVGNVFFTDSIELGNNLKLAFGLTDATKNLSFGFSFKNVLFATSSDQSTGDTQSQRSTITSITRTGLSFKGGAATPVRWWALGEIEGENI